MHLYILSYFVCAVSFRHSLRLRKPHLARQKYIISCLLHGMALKLESFSRENNVLTCDCDIYCKCAHGCDVSACAAGNKRIGSESARRETDRTITDPGRSCEKSVDSDHWPANRGIAKKKVYITLEFNWEPPPKKTRFIVMLISLRELKLINQPRMEFNSCEFIFYFILFFLARVYTSSSASSPADCF